MARFRTVLAHQVHHLDPDSYERFYRRETLSETQDKPSGLVARQRRSLTKGNDSPDAAFARRRSGVRIPSAPPAHLVMLVLARGRV